MAPGNPLNHTFRCKTSHPSGLQQSEGGVITEVSPDGTQVKVRILSRQPNVDLKPVPLSVLDVGPQYVADTKGLPVILTGAVIQGIAIRQSVPGSASYANDTDPFRKAVSFLLSGIFDHKDRINQLSDSQLSLIKDDSAIMQTSQRFRNNVQQVNPQCFAAISKKGFTINDILPTLAELCPNDRSAGIYLGIFSNFKGERSGSLPRAFVGQTNDFSNSINSHISTVTNLDAGQEVHQVMREATKRQWFKLAVHRTDEGGSDTAGKAMRDVMETTFMMLFSSMSARVMSPRLMLTGDLWKNVAKEYDAQESAKVITELARAAFLKAGFALPGTPGRENFGLHQFGCNFRIPLGGEEFTACERVVWTRQDAGTRFIFHSSSLTFKDDKLVTSMSYSDHRGIKSLHIQPTKEELDEMGIQNEDEYFPVWEVQKSGPHPVPFFRVCDIGPWSNWMYANKVAFKLVWRSGNDGKIKTKYFQRQGRHRFVEDCTAHGALLDYSLGVGLYEYFSCDRFPSAQPWSANFGSAKIVIARLNNFEQTITVSRMSSPANTTLRGPQFSADVCRVAMEKLGLHNVNGPWNGFNWEWLDDPSQWKDGEIPPPEERKGYKKRSQCDYCFLVEKPAYSDMDGSEFQCERVCNSNICLPCNKMGRPCSYTGLSFIFGPDDWQDEVKTAKASKGELHKAAAKALLNQPHAEGALRVHEIGEKSVLVAIGS